jgi:hypothetical protein
MDLLIAYYKFTEDSRQCLDSNKILSFFIDDNMIAYKLIITAISLEDFKNIIKDSLNKEESFIKLTTILKQELEGIEEYKIDICRTKLKFLIDSLYKRDKIEVYEKSTKMSSKFRNEITWNGYRTDIMKSGLQKYIRRGILEKSLYCAGELDLFKDDMDRGETIRTNFLHRLMIIYLEDVENYALFNKVNKLINFIFDEREKKSRNPEIKLMKKY